MKSEPLADEVTTTRAKRALRRSFTDEQRLKVVTDCLEPGASVSGVSLRYGINANVVRKWIIRHRMGGLVKASTTLTPEGSAWNLTPSARKTLRIVAMRGFRSHLAPCRASRD